VIDQGKTYLGNKNVYILDLAKEENECSENL